MAVKCRSCGKANPDGTSFCQFCGTRMGEAGLPPARAEKIAAPSGADAAGHCPSCGSDNPSGTNFCQMCGTRLRGRADVPPAVGRPTSAVFGAAGPIPGAADATPAAPTHHRAQAAKAPLLGATQSRLVAVRRDGSDGTSYPLNGEQIDIGRSDGDLLFDDPHLARRHARILVRGGEHVLTPLDSRNGVYIRVRSPVDVADGDHVLIGKQVLRFELVPESERSLRPAVEHGVVYFGTPVKPPWGRLRQLTAAGTTRDLFHLCRTDVILGREQGDIIFSDDEFLSRRHAQMSFRGSRARLEDLGSSNGTFIRLRGPHPLMAGEMIRMGDELLRFELG